MRIRSKFFFTLILVVFLFSLCAEAKIYCRMSNYASLFGLGNSYQGIVLFYIGKELNKKSWWKVWEDDYEEKRIYATFNIDGERIVVKTDMSYSSYYSNKFNREYFDKIMKTKTEGFDQDDKKWFISWNFINPYKPYKKKNRNSVF